MIDATSKEDLVEAARILDMQAARYARKYDEIQLSDLAHLLSTTGVDDETMGLFLDCTEAFVGVRTMVSAGVGDEAEPLCSKREAIWSSPYMLKP